MTNEELLHSIMSHAETGLLSHLERVESDILRVLKFGSGAVLRPLIERADGVGHDINRLLDERDRLIAVRVKLADFNKAEMRAAMTEFFNARWPE